MPLTDSQPLRNLLAEFLPDIVISDVAKPSGQRLVYYCSLNDRGPLAPSIPARFQNFVLKVAEGTDYQSIAYVQREIRILNSLKCKHFPQLLYNDVFSINPFTDDPLPHPLFVTAEELIEGQPLSECCHQFQSEATVLDLILTVARAMQPLWERRPSIVHRDLKPDNILIRPDMSPVIIDLAIAREAREAGVTVTFAPFGPCTPLYASPEQATNKKSEISFKSDFFALGVIAYELLSGRNPFGSPGDHRDTVFARVVEHAPPFLTEVSNCSGHTSGLISQLLQKAPYKRPRTPSMFICKLTEALSHVR